MIQYIYFVKCPECEDEPFDLFDDAKDYAIGCLSKQPIITQTEVDRNDFGECIASTDLGTIWSWEDMAAVDKEPTISTFKKSVLGDYDPDQDAEFANLDNSLDVLDQVPDNFRKPIPADMTIKDLVEEMEKNENEVECTWCNDLFNKDECRYEVNLGWLCSRCEAAIKSRGETLAFRENNYWDFLDESAEESGKENKTWTCFYNDEEIGSVEANTEDEALEKMQKEYPEFNYGDHDGCFGVELEEDISEAKSVTEDISNATIEDVEDFINYAKERFPGSEAHFDGDKNEVVITLAAENVNESKVLHEGYDPDKEIEFEYSGVETTVFSDGSPEADEVDVTLDGTYSVPASEVATVIWENFITDEDVEEVPGGLDALYEDEKLWEDFLNNNFDKLLDKYHDQLLKHFEEAAAREIADNYSWSDYQEDEAGRAADYWYDYYNDR